MLTEVLAVIAAGALGAALVLHRRGQRDRHEIARSMVRARLGHALAEGLVSDPAIDRAVRMLVPEHADWCVVHLVDRGRVRRAAVVHRDPATERGLRAAFDQTPFATEARVGPAQVIRTGQPEYSSDFRPAPDERSDLHLTHLPPFRSFMSVPIKARRDTLGALTLHSARPRAYDDRDLLWGEDLGLLIGLSVENRRLYAEARELFEQSVSANFVSTPEGEILACNATFATLLGFGSVEEALAAPAASLYAAPADRAGFLDQLRRQRRVTGHELLLRRRDGAVLTVVADAAGEVDEAGELVKVRGSLADRTGQRALELRLQQGQRLEAVGQLAGGIAHDFNNLLTVIIGCADLLKMDGRSAATDDHDPLEELTKAARRAASLTQQLLAFSRRQVLQPRLLHLNDALQGVHSMLRRLVPPRLDLKVDLAPAIDAVQVDPGQLDQVIVNLVVNAVDATPGTGTITLGTRPVELTAADADEYPYVIPGRYVALTVADTGSGMDEATRARVFEPFFTTKPVGKGTGLGMSTVYGIVKQSGGYIWVASAPGSGTTVRICLPAVDEAAGT